MNRFFLPITKINEEQRLVYGTLAAEVPDHANEIMDYEGSKQAFIDWASHYEKVTGGKSQGNLRVMHTDKVAGAFTQISFDDSTKSVLAIAKVVDDAEWEMCKAGGYSGFSIGAKGTRSKDTVDKKLTRYVVSKMVEASLVDAPCIPTATFEYIKADNQVELRKFQIAETLETSQTRYESPVSKDFKSKFKQVTPALEKVGSTDRTIAGFKKVAQSAGLVKSLWDASDLANVLMTANWIRQNLANEAELEGDDSPIPEQLRTWLDDGAKILQDLVSEESAELTADAPDDDSITLSEKKEGTQMAEETKKSEEVKTAEAVAKAEEVKTEEVAKTDASVEIKKSLDSALEKFSTFESKVSKFDEAVSKLNERADSNESVLKDLASSMQTMVEMLKSIPAPSKGVATQVVTVTKEQDSGVTKDESKDTHNLFKMALAPENAKPMFHGDPRFAVSK
jgi:hypothetical protein